MGKPSSITSSTIRYAPYIEDRHSDFINTAYNHRLALMSQSPYAAYGAFPTDDIDVEDAFFGAGYTIASFPSLYDMYGKFMAGLDIDVLFDQLFEETVNGSEINNLISAEADRVSDDIEVEALPRFETGMRDMNAVMSSTFVIGRELLEANRVKAVSRFSAESRYRMLPVVTERWTKHLDWNKMTVEEYAQILKLYISAEMDIKTHNWDIQVKHRLWPFTLLQYEGVCLGVLNGARDVSEVGHSPSKAQKAIGGAMTGASAGAMIGGPIGAALGGVAGLIGGIV